MSVYLIQWSSIRYLCTRDLTHDRILREGRASHEMIDSGVADGESRSAVRHYTLSLSRSDCGAQIGFGGGAENTLLTL